MMLLCSKRRVVAQRVLSHYRSAARPFSDTAVGKSMDARNLIEVAEKL